MPDHEASRSDVTLEEVAGAMAQMAADHSKLKAENADLAARLERLERGSRTAAPPDMSPGHPHGLFTGDPLDDTTAAGEATKHSQGLAAAADGASSITRRSAFKAFGAAAAAGAGVALGATVLGAEPVAASPITYVRLGGANSTGADTSITTSAGHGVLGSTSDATSAGIGGRDTSAGGGRGIEAESTHGLGLVAQGGLAPLLLTPSTTTGPPTSGSHATGEVYVDAVGFVYICSVVGSPGTWQRFTPAAPGYENADSDAGLLGKSGSVNLFSTPIRIFDTRTSTGPIGPNGGIVVQVGGLTFQSVSIPANVAGVLGNVTAVQPSGDGYLTLFASAQVAPPLVSNLNFQSGDIARGNFCVVGLNGGQMIINATGARTEVVFDATGFIYASPSAGE